MTTKITWANLIRMNRFGVIFSQAAIHSGQNVLLTLLEEDYKLICELDFYPKNHPASIVIGKIRKFKFDDKEGVIMMAISRNEHAAILVAMRQWIIANRSIVDAKNEISF